MILKVRDVLVIDWIDSVFAVGWYSQEQADEYIPKAICQSIGYCVKETDEFITLASIGIYIAIMHLLVISFQYPKLLLKRNGK